MNLRAQNWDQTRGWRFDGWFYDDDKFTEPVVDVWSDADSALFKSPGANADLIIHAKWVPYLYDVKYEINGHGVPIHADYYAEIWDDPIDYTSLVSVPGYRFDGWFYDDTTFNNPALATKGNTVWDDPVAKLDGTKNDSITLYAKWTTFYYDVHYDVQGHSVPKHADYYAEIWDDPIDYTSLDDVSGYRFESWVYDPAYCQITVPAQDRATDIWDLNQTPLDSTRNDSITLYACWEEYTYTITYDRNGHGASPAPIVDVPWGTTTPYPLLVQNGYTFDGWYYDDPAWVFGDLDWGTTTWTKPVTNTSGVAGVWTDQPDSSIDPKNYSSVVLHAKWTPIIYTLTYYDGDFGTLDPLTCAIPSNSNGMTLGAGFTQFTYNIETTTFTPDCTTRTPIDDHHDFEGFVGNYFDDMVQPQLGDLMHEIEIGSIGNKTLTAEWYPFEYEVHYSNPGSGTFLHPGDDIDDFGGEPAPHTGLVWEGVFDKDDAHSEFINPDMTPEAPPGWQFDGWWTKNGCNAAIERECNGDWGKLAPEIVNDPDVFPLNPTDKSAADRSTKVTFYARWIQINYTFVWIPDEFERVQLHNVDGVYCLASTSGVAADTFPAFIAGPTSTAGPTNAGRDTWIPDSLTDCATVTPTLDVDSEPEPVIKPQTMTVSGNADTLMYEFHGLHWKDNLPDLTLLLESPQRDEALALEYHHEGVYFEPTFAEEVRVPGHQDGEVLTLTVADVMLDDNLQGFDPLESLENPLSALDIAPEPVTGLSLSSLALGGASPTFPALVAGPTGTEDDALSADGVGPAINAGKGEVAQHAATALNQQAQAHADAAGADVVFWGKTTPQTIPCANGAQDPPKCTPAPGGGGNAVAATGVGMLQLLWLLLGVLCVGFLGVRNRFGLASILQHALRIQDSSNGSVI
ncbi:hypothetical protein FACS1894125_5940 [Actinomycetota bacterium]|nr:hypothetical protein FACS1894125_5940 [Actinomycetota bacterium]